MLGGAALELQKCRSVVERRHVARPHARANHELVKSVVHAGSIAMCLPDGIEPPPASVAPAGAVGWKAWRRLKLMRQTCEGCGEPATRWSYAANGPWARK